MISLLITIETPPDRTEAFLRHMMEAARDAVAKEPGCRRFEVARVLEKPNCFTLAELYDDMAALEAHRLTPHFLRFKERAEAENLILSKTSALGEIVD